MFIFSISPVKSKTILPTFSFPIFALARAFGEYFFACSVGSFLNKRQRMNKEEIKELQQFEGLIDGLISDDFGCCDNFLSPSIVTGLNNNLKHLNDAGKLKPSGIGNKENFHQDKNVRSDQIHWLDDKSINQFEMLFTEKVGKFMDHLNSTCYTSLKSFESHYAAYEKKSHYKRHIDQFKNEHGRKFSVVLYLNQDWKEEDGGLLSLYRTAKEQMNISPLGGRMVFFRSDEMEHEVHPSFTRERTSIAGWMRDA
jgi:SM-20-related protein